jgi:hypothetical protein
VTVKDIDMYNFFTLLAVAGFSLFIIGSIDPRTANVLSSAAVLSANRMSEALTRREFKYLSRVQTVSALTHLCLQSLTCAWASIDGGRSAYRCEASRGRIRNSS